MRRFACLFVLVAVLVAGCGGTPSTPGAAAGVAQAFLAARSARDPGALQALLTEPAQEALDRSALTAYLAAETIIHGGVGPPRQREPNWIQVPVRNIQVRRDETRTVWPESWLTLHYDGSRWRVAWVDPLIAGAYLAYENSAFIEELELGRQIADIDPYHYRGYLEQHFAYLGLKQFRSAELWLARAMETATPPQQPDAEDAMARFKLSLGSPDDAEAHARKSLALAAPYVPDTYSQRWQADTLVVLGRAQLARGDRKGAEETAHKAAELDPQNGPLAVFRQQLAAPGAPPPRNPAP